MKPDEIENKNETISQIELEKLLEQKQNETEALKRLIGVLKKKSIPKTGTNQTSDQS